MRIPLTAPEEVDEEVLGWLRRAYDENAAPPPPRRPARRPAPVLGPLTVVIEGFDLPGLTCRPEPGGQATRTSTSRCPVPARTGLPCRRAGRPRPAIEPVPGDAPSAHWEVPVTVRRGADGFDFTGPFVRGTRDDRNLGLAWGDVPGDGTLRLFRGAKLRLVDIDPGVIEEAIRPGHRLVARIRLTDARGTRSVPESILRPSPGRQNPASGAAASYQSITAEATGGRRPEGLLRRRLTA